MVKINHHFFKLSSNYLFQEIAQKTTLFLQENPHVSLSNLGIGDILEPLLPCVASALKHAIEEMEQIETVKGYPPATGYLFLKEAILKHDYKNLPIHVDDLFISNGAKNDLGHLQELFSTDTKIAIQDPTYPVYLETNIMAGRTGSRIKNNTYGRVLYLPCTESNHFQPSPPSSHVDLVYLCSPNNPTGVAMNREQLKQWVAYAKQEKAILLFDGAYSAYISDPSIPKSIYEIEGASEVAVEIRSFSKTAGFTNLRCSYTVIPKALQVFDCGVYTSLQKLWTRRQETKFGGVFYPVQQAAKSLYTPQGQAEVQERITSYLDKAKRLREALKASNWTCYGGIDAPYVWAKAPFQFNSWQSFDFLLEKAHIVTVPGSGFGRFGEGFVRFSTLVNDTTFEEALHQLKELHTYAH